MSVNPLGHQRIPAENVGYVFTLILCYRCKYLMFHHLEARGVEPVSLSHSFNIPSRKKKRRIVELVEPSSGFGRFLAAKIEISYGAGQTVNLLALRLQWFESTPTQASPRAILQVLKPLGG